MHATRIPQSLATILASATVVVSAQAPAAPTSDEVQALGIQAYVYAYPLVLMERTRAAFPNRPLNEFTHARAYPTPNARTVIRPNVDTLYSTAWLDLSREPVVMSVPEMGDRYYLVQLLDAWTETFAVPGTRTTGNKAGKFAIVGPDWKGALPAGLTEIKSPTNIVWIIGRIQTNGSDDYPNVRALQEGFRLALLSGSAAPARPAPSADVTKRSAESLTPPEYVAQLDAVEFFSAFAAAMTVNPPHPEDASLVERFRAIGLVPGRPFDRSTLTPAALQALDRAVKEAQQLVGRNSAPVRNGWRVDIAIGRYGTDYQTRAAIARRGLGALPADDAIYPSTFNDGDGQPLTGAKRYVIHIAKSDLPPVNAFWSLTLYDADGYFVPNAINRYAIGDRDRLRFNDDGSLDLYVQHARPAEDQVSNWLPAPAGDFNLTLRLYWPKPEALSGAWLPPSVRRADQ